MRNSFFQSAFKISKKIGLFFLLLLIPQLASASESVVPSIGPVRIEFVLFGLILLGVALLHKHTFWVALTGLTVLLIFKFVFEINTWQNISVFS